MPLSIHVGHEFLKFGGVLGIVDVPHPVYEALSGLQCTTGAGNSVRNYLGVFAVVETARIEECGFSSRRGFTLRNSASPCDVSSVPALDVWE